MTTSFDISAKEKQIPN